MTHAIRIRCADGNVPDQAEVETARDQFQTIAEDQNAEYGFRDDDLIGEPHWQCLYRFDDAEDLSAIVDKFSENTFAGMEWYIIHSHVCNHGSDESGACDGWVIETERGSVPEEYR